MTKARATPSTMSELLKPVVGDLRPALAMSTADYLQLLDWTRRRAGQAWPHRTRRTRNPVVD
jgi:hypothetical protein